MKWISVDEKLSGYDTEVLVWITCPKCRDDKPHTHNLLGTEYPIHRFAKTALYRTSDAFKGKPGWKHCLKDHWGYRDAKITRRCYVDSSYEI